MSNYQLNRRRALQAFGAWVAASPLLNGQQLSGEPEGRITPLGEFVNVLEFEPMAKRKLSGAVFSNIAGGDRADMERCTFRPRLMVDTSKMNLSMELFGESMFAPILVGPASSQQMLHQDGELAMVRGGAAAKAVTVISCLASQPIEAIVEAAKGPIWCQVFVGPEARRQAEKAIGLGCKVLFITVSKPIDWMAIDKIRQGLKVPVVVKGIMNPTDAGTAVKRGFQGIVISNYRAAASPSAFGMLPAIVDVAGGKIPILIDGGFRRGTDILKAMILGAEAVMVTRPVLWGLAGYGADGVQSVMEMLQTELARNMIMIGAVTPKDLKRDMIKIHSR